MKRRAFITLLGGAAAWPLAARAQGDRKPRIGVLMNLAESDPEARPRLDAFERRLQELGWTKDRNVLIDYRWTAGDYDRMRSYAAELVGLGSNAILAAGAPVTEILQKTTGTVPIVFVLVSDPIGSGFIPSLAHPGGNMTGVTYVEYTLGGKWLEMLKEIAPSVTRVAVIHNSENRLVAGFLPAIEAVAPSLGVQLIPTSVRDAADIPRAIDAFAGESNLGLLVLPDVLAVVNRELIIALAARHRLPALYGFRYRGTNGGLISHGVTTRRRCTGKRRRMLIASLKARSRAISLSSNRPNSSWRSTERPPQHSGSAFHPRCSPLLTR